MRYPTKFMRDNEDKLKEVRGLVLKAFKDLRKQGLVARANYSCCSSCAGDTIASELDDKIAKGLSERNFPLGCVYWHQQDDEHYFEDGKLHLRYGQIECENSKRSTALSSKDVGGLVLEALRSQGLIVDWDGNEDATIVVVGMPEAVAA